MRGRSVDYLLDMDKELINKKIRTYFLRNIFCLKLEDSNLDSVTFFSTFNIYFLYHANNFLISCPLSVLLFNKEWSHRTKGGSSCHNKLSISLTDGSRLKCKEIKFHALFCWFLKTFSCICLYGYRRCFNMRLIKEPFFWAWWLALPLTTAFTR